MHDFARQAANQPGSKPDLDYVRDYFLIEQTELAPADAIFIFGNKHGVKQSAEKAAELFFAGYSERIIVTGGVKTDSGFTEADAIAAALQEKGIPAKNMLVERHSTNTQENIEMALDLIDQSGIKRPQSIIAIGNIAAGRRFLMTLKKRWPDVFAMAANFNAFTAPLGEWQGNETFKEKVLNEYRKIESYLACGYIEEIDISAINHQAKKLRAGITNTIKGQAYEPH